MSNAEFIETLELAGESGVKFNGVLCGRATWKEGIPVYAKQGAEAFRKWLETEGVKNINNVNAVEGGQAVALFMARRRRSSGRKSWFGCVGAGCLPAPFSF